jgi:photosystem II stability/assembly factor-like uncharacterized protein
LGFVLIAIVLIAAVVAACSGDGDDGATSSTPASAAASSTSSTTAPALTPGSSPVSASFVSPSRGWVLERGPGSCAADGAECRFALAETADGGASWRVVQTFSAPIGPTRARIRFATATDGFLFGEDALLVTRDGGASWERVHAPFDGVQDLAVAGATVYVVGYRKGAQPFGLWTAPVATLEWTKDPVDIPLGAGPVPEQQLVLSHGAGWILDEDRLLLDGARRGGEGAAWKPWEPPCDGSATMAASTADDVVVLCAEGVWTGPEVTYELLHSRDGGVTFDRRPMLFAGSLTTPAPGTVVVATTGAGILRSTDAGRTWSVVLSPAEFPARAGGGVFDEGFTTSTQGFVVYAKAGMYMTHDAGATWQHVSVG